jgi:hypothetical protein
MGIEMEEIPDQMSLAALGERCQREIANFLKGLPFDDRFCLEIFHRAIVGKDEQAWDWIVKSYRRMVIGWLRRHPRRELAMRYEPEEDYYVGYTFTRFWQATTKQELKFNSLGAAHKYLKSTLNAAISDTLRAHARPLVPLPEAGMGFPEEPAAEHENDDARELWEIIDNLLPTRREKQVAYLFYHCGLKPREIMQHVPGLFSNVEEIYHACRNIQERLLRNIDQIRWKLSDEEH